MHQMHQKSTSKITQVYVSLLPTVALISLLLLFIIPKDPKNAWLLNLSKSRWIMIVGTLTILMGLSVFAVKFWQSKELRSKIDAMVGDFLSEFGWIIPTTLFIFGGIFMGTFFGLFFTPYSAMLLRASPLVFFAIFAIFQSGIFAIIYLRRIRFDEKYSTTEITLHINPRKVALILVIIVGILVSLSWSIFLFEFMAQDQDFTLNARIFHFDHEQNFPTFATTIYLIFTVGLISVIIHTHSTHSKKYKKHWIILALGFAYISLDEFVGLHEKLIIPLQNLFQDKSLNLPAYFHFAWVIIGIPIVFVFAISYFRFYWNLPSKVKPAFALAFIIYISGALVFEMFGSYLHVKHHISGYISRPPLTILTTTIEEVLELIGLIILIYGLLEYIQKQLKGETIKILGPN